MPTNDNKVQSPFLYFIAEDDTSIVTGEPGEDADDIYERFYEEYGYYPDRVMGVKSEVDGAIDAEVVMGE